MEHRHLGRSGLQISAITFGSWLTHDSSAADSAKATLRTALDAGITTFDTADVYGRPEFGAAEELLGDTLHGVRRESLEILTKVCLRTGPGANDEGLSRKHILESCHASLRRLRTDYVDLYQAHRFDPNTPLEETMTAFADLVRQGKALYIGVSEWTAAQIEAGAALARELRVPLISNQPQYSMLWRVIEAEVVPAGQAAGLGQIVFSPVAQGALTGKYLPGTQPPADSRAASDKGSAFVGRYLADPVLTAVQRLKPIADDYGVSLAQLAVAWVLSRPGVSAAIIGASRPEQVAENVAAVDVKLDEAALARIDAALVDPVHGDLVERDPAKTARPFDVMPAWRR
ncbi:MAG: aldo/keto reductase family protein [Hamadaea sp.]|nr:aldo/keto reductase family protein [Hamadaea sp.]